MLKRYFDVVASAAALFVFWPLLAVAAVAIRATMGAPVLFRQSRPGLNGEVFELVKLRTMRTGSGTDPVRITKLGQFLRSTSIDELPELWNVIRGNMSLVGPRPLLVEYLPLYDQRQATRHRVRPGLTGLAQVRGRNAISWEERFELDAQYVEAHSLSLDLKILALTVWIVLRRNGISGPGVATMVPFGRSEASK